MIKRIAALLLLSIILSAGILPAETPQSGDMKALTDKGMAAAQKNNWADAIKYFNDARSLSPLDPAPVFNLALALDKSKGREMGAINAYEAYLALKPDAPNADAIRKRVGELEAQIESDISMLLDKSMELSRSIGDDASGSDSSVAMVLLAMGDFDKAFKITEAAPYKYYNQRIGYYEQIVRALAAAGKYKEAYDIKDRIVREAPPEGNDKREANDKLIAAIVQGKCERKDFAGALADIPSIGKDSQFYSYSWVSMMQVFDKDLEGGLKNALLVSSPAFRVDSLLKVADGQTDAGDASGAAKTIALAENVLFKEMPPTDGMMENNKCGLVEAYSRSGKLRDAERIYALMKKDNPNPYTPCGAEGHIAVCEALLKNIDRARERVLAISFEPSRWFAFKAIVQEQVKAKDFDGAEKTIGMIKDESTRLRSTAALLYAKAKASGKGEAEAAALSYQASITYKDLEEMDSLSDILEKNKKEDPKWIANAIALNAYSRALFLQSLRKGRIKNQK